MSGFGHSWTCDVLIERSLVRQCDLGRVALKEPLGFLEPGDLPLVNSERRFLRRHISLRRRSASIIKITLRA